MSWVLRDSLSPPPLTAAATSGGSSPGNSMISPSILIVVIILAGIFFVFGLLHLLVRLLMMIKPPERQTDEELESVTAVQGQLRQLFHLHDSGVDQSFIDNQLPVFHYKAITGLENNLVRPFDCAVCLCEFEPEDKLRLLPKCSHAFHVDCIDTWLLSHSTCPLCRSNLLSNSSPNRSCSPIIMILESHSDSSRNDETVTDIEESEASDSGDKIINGGSAPIGKTEELEVETARPPEGDVFLVKLGKFSADSRRGFSMGSLEYTIDEASALRVPIRTPIKKEPGKSRKLAHSLKPGHGAAMSECYSQSRRNLGGLEEFKTSTRMKNLYIGNGGGEEIARKKESFSISKIWLRGSGEKQSTPSRHGSSAWRAVSLRFPGSRRWEPKEGDKIGESKGESCEIEIGSEAELEIRSCNGSLDYLQEPASSSYRALSFTRRTLAWLVVGRQTQNWVGDSSSLSPTA